MTVYQNVVKVVSKLSHADNAAAQWDFLVSASGMSWMRNKKIPQALGLTFVLVCSEQNAYSVQTAVVGWVGWFHFSTQA